MANQQRCILNYFKDMYLVELITYTTDKASNLTDVLTLSL